jgi:hypothetical protein
MRIYFALFLGMILFPLFGSAQLDPSLCAGFRTGTFAYRNDSSNAVLIKRTHHQQEERIKKTGVVTRFKIKWLSPCSYEIKQVWSNSRKIRKNDGAVTQVMITQAPATNIILNVHAKRRKVLRAIQVRFTGCLKTPVVIVHYADATTKIGDMRYDAQRFNDRTIYS